MADRLSQYPMMANFNPALMQQQAQQQQLSQQQAQQAQQQQQDTHGLMPSAFNDQGRTWSQIQHTQQQLFRQGGGDMTSQQNAQMLDLIRTQNNIRNQQQQSNGQQFGLGGQQIGGMGAGSGNGHQQPQSQPFLDSGSNQPQQANMSPAFTGAGLPSAVQMQPSMSRNAMIQALQANQAHANPSVARQLELMLAQGQPQNSPMMQQRMEQHQRQQQQQAQHQQQQPQVTMSQGSSGEMFAPGMVDRRPSPAHPNPQGPNPMGGTPPRLNIAELNQRAQALRAHIETQENLFRQLGQQRPPDLQKLRQLQGEIKSKKDYLAKMTAALQHMGNASGQQQNWSFNANSNAQVGGHPQPQSQPQPGQNNIQPSPSNMHAQIQPGGNLLPQGMIARPPSGQPQPHQHQQQHTTLGGPGGAPGRPFSTQISPNMNPQFPFNGNSASSPSMGPPTTSSGNIPAPPLEKSRFESAYKNYSATKGVKHEPHLMNVDGRSIDLYMLHTQVMLEGGVNKVHGMDLWSVIGGRMGFVQFPGTDTEPAKSGPGVAQRLAQVYKEYLAGFDQVYINSFIESRIKNANAEEARRLAAQQQQQQAQEAAQRAAAAASANGGPSTQPQARPLMNAQQMHMVIGYANQTAEELRRSGVQEKIIQFVEQNRAHLQRTVMEQGMFRGNFQNQGLRPPEQHGMAMATPFLGGGPHQNTTPSGGQTPQQFMQQRQQQNGLLPMQGNNFMDNRQPQLAQQQQQHPQNGNPIMRASKEQAMAFIHKTKREFQTNNLPNMRGVEVPMDQRQEFMMLLQELQHISREMDPKLPMYFFVLKSDEAIRKLIAIIMTVNHQGALLNTPNPRYVVGTDILRTMMAQVKTANATVQSYIASQIRPQGGPQQLLTSGGGMSPMPETTRPPSQAIPQQHIPPQLAPPNRLPPNLRPPQPVMKKASASTPGATTVTAVSTPTPPAYSASTPVASAPTPTHTASSPQAPKSPKGKAPQKPKNPSKRRVSVKNSPAPIPIPSAADQGQAPASSGSVKRPREDDNLLAFGTSPVASGSATNEPSPPKRVKTEWDGPPSDALKKKAEAVENVKTEEDASAFLEQMTELIKMAGEGQQESLSSDISETLDQILKGYGTVPEGPEAALGLSSLGGLGESSMPSSSSSAKPPADEFVEFFDFSSFGTLDDDNDDDSKAPTPELVSSSSTNPSPESGSEADTAHHALLSSTESKTEELPDLLRLGPWKEIDGGESAYYQSGDWKWDSPMPTQEQPWAIFTT